MKKFIYLGLVLGITACQPPKPINYAIISGNIKNNLTNKISIYNSNFVKRDLKIDENGHFTDTIKIKKGSYYFLLYNKTGLSIYLEPSFNLSFKADANNIDSTLVFKGKGLQEYKFLKIKDKLLNSLKKQSDYKYIGNLTEANFLYKMDSVKKIELALLKKTNHLSKLFRFLEKQDINYSWANKLNNYEEMRHRVTKGKNFKVSANFYDYKKDFLKENDNLLGIRDYIEFFKNHMRYLTQEAYKKDSLIDYSQTYLQFVADSIKNQDLKNSLLYRDAQYSITYANDIEKYYKTFINASTNKVNNAKIKKIYQALKKVAKGNPSPQFVDYENYKGGTTSLKDLKGKFVYVDVWATWCGPCKAEIPFLKKIEKQYHKKNIAFVSLSVDTKKAHKTWQKMIKEKKLGGIQLFSDNNWNSKFVGDYMIKAIPRFILIDPNGNIISANAPRPSSNDLKKLFAKYKL